MGGNTYIPPNKFKEFRKDIKDLNFQHHKKSGRDIPRGEVPTSPNQIYYLNLPWDYPHSLKQMKAIFTGLGFRVNNVRTGVPWYINQFYGYWGDVWHFIKVGAKYFPANTHQEWHTPKGVFLFEFNGTDLIKMTKPSGETCYV